jgi:16S rRNA (adenine1518-N6/adenine1519-N6)-dimethyltransferase
MLQREVAERLVAYPGTKHYGVLAILTRVDADAAIVLNLPPGAFRPVPKVRSSVVHLSFRGPRPTGPDRALFDRLVRDVFTRRRKTILNALKPVADRLGGSAVDALAGAGIDPSRRPETLELTEFAALAEFLASTRK